MTPRGIVRRGGLVVAVLLGIGGLGWLTGSLTTPVIADTQNVFALHDRTSSQYDKDCTNSSCHAAVLTERSLNSAIHTAHVTMVNTPGLVPGKEADDKCRFCHRTVNWQNQVFGNLRKTVDTRLCRLCHGPDGEKQFYQVGLSLADFGADPVKAGAGFYTLLCDGCHGPFASSNVGGESASEIQKAIRENEGGMAPLADLTADEIQAIAAALATVASHD